MLTVVVNGEEKQYKEDTTLLEMMNQLSIADKVMAAAVNMNIIKQDAWDAHTLKNGDKVELLDFVGGG